MGFILMSLSSLMVTYFTTYKVEEDAISVTKNNLEMLNTAMFQSLRNAMNTGDPAQIAKAEEEARQIKGVTHLTIAKSKPLIEMYSPDSKFTNDTDILRKNKTNNKSKTIKKKRYHEKKKNKKKKKKQEKEERKQSIKT